MKDVSLKDLLEAGCHFGHQATRWYPKASDYIYAEKDNVHIIDLVKTKVGLEEAGRYLSDLAKSGGSVIFTGVKRQAKGVLEEVAKKVKEAKAQNFYYVLERWPGGLLTNFAIMQKNLKRIEELEIKSRDESYTKKERLLAQREREKLLKIYEGLVGLSKLPDAIFVIDVKKLAGAIREATRTGVKIVAICDTNIDPTVVDYQIPANDDAVGSIKIIMDYLGEAWIEGNKEFNNSNKANGANDQ
jgi:small subunit ribosomal protein S2